MAYFPTTGATGKWIFEKIHQCKKQLRAVAQVQVHWGCSDLFQGCIEYLQLMEQQHSSYKHFFDITHLVKIGRNYLLDYMLKNEDCPQGFCIQKQFPLWEQSPDWQKQIKFEDLHPVDKMKFDHVKHLLTFASELMNHVDPCVNAIGIYLKHLKMLYDGLNNNEQPLCEKLSALSEVNNYFSSWHSNPSFREHFVTRNFMMALRTTLKSFQAMCEEFNGIYGCPLQVSSIFQDIIVENSFSIIQRKCRYPNLWQYEIYQQHGWSL